MIRSQQGGCRANVHVQVTLSLNRFDADSPSASQENCSQLTAPGARKRLQLDCCRIVPVFGAWNAFGQNATWILHPARNWSPVCFPAGLGACALTLVFFTKMLHRRL